MKRLVVCIAVCSLAIMAVACGGGASTNSTSTLITSTTRTPTSANTSTATTSSVKLHLTVTGDYKGQSVQGSVIPGSLQCAPVMNGDKQGLQVTWGGTVDGVGQVSGDMLFAGGLPPITFGDGKSQGTASVALKGDYQNRYGASSALGTGTAQANPDNSGTIDADLDGDTAGKIRLQGSWTC